MRSRRSLALSNKTKYATARAPIGVFDSGVGGLTVASGIEGLLPEETLIYFGDTEHLPYGDKSRHAIRSYIANISTFLADRGCKLIVVACNSASSVLDDELLQHMALPVVNVIDPVVESVVKNKDLRRIGVIGTRRTVRSEAYSAKIKAARPDVELLEKATPLLASVIEEGFYDGEVARLVLSKYLDGMDRMDALILGCTHYPLLKNTIREIVGDDVLLIDAPDVVASSVKSTLIQMDQVSDQREDHQFFVSDLTENFQEMARLFFGSSIALTEHSLSEH